MIGGLPASPPFAGGARDITTDKELEIRCKRLSEGISEGLHILAHDPSLALYRLQEHVRKSLPVMVEKKIEVAQLHAGLQGGCCDLENAIETVDGMAKAGPTFAKIYELLRSSMYYKQQLDYEMRRLEQEKRNRGVTHTESHDSLYQEMRKSRSTGQLKAGGGASAADLISESGRSRSTVSTPVSEYPEGMLGSGVLSPGQSSTSSEALEIAAAHSRADTVVEKRPPQPPNSTRSSTPTSGADSPINSDEELDSDQEKTRHLTSNNT